MHLSSYNKFRQHFKCTFCLFPLILLSLPGNNTQALLSFMHLEMRVDSFHLETMLDEQDQCNVKLCLQILHVIFLIPCVKMCLNVIVNFAMHWKKMRTMDFSKKLFMSLVEFSNEGSSRFFFESTWGKLGNKSQATFCAISFPVPKRLRGQEVVHAKISHRVGEQNSRWCSGRKKRVRIGKSFGKLQIQMKL